MNRRDLELLSAYLDGQLDPADLARMESRLQSQSELRGVLEELRAARDLLRKLPTRKAPRNFTLSRQVVSVKPPMPRSYPFLQFASAAATLLLFLTVAINTLGPRLVIGAAAPAPLLGIGGGAGPEESWLAATEAPAAELPQQSALAPTPTPSGQDMQRGLPTSVPKLGESGGPEVEGPDSRSKAPVPQGVQWALVVVAIACAIATLGLHRSAVAKWRK